MAPLTDPAQVAVNGVEATFRAGTSKVGDVELEVTATDKGRGVELRLIVRNSSRQPVRLERIEVRLPAWPAQVLEHGHQSWSVVRRCRPDDARPERATVPDWVRGSYVSVAEDAGGTVTGDQFLITELGVVGFLGGASHFGTVTAGPVGVVATAHLDGVPLDPGVARPLEPLWLADGPPGPLYSEFADHWGQHSSARVKAPAPVGWCSWYQFFGDVTAEDIRRNLALAAAHGFDLVQIDDGYQAAIGDWLQTAPGWDDSMQGLAGEISAVGLQAGIWTAPFLASDNSRLAADHPEWIVKHHSGHPAKAMQNDAWGGWARSLDTSNPAVLEHLRQTYDALTSQGYGYHKIDFCFSASLPGDRYNNRLTRAEVLRAGLDAVRDGIGDSFLLGCGCPFGPAVGVVDAMRVSADVAPYWEADRAWPGFEECAPSALNAIKGSVLRAPLHRRVFINDPDCLLLRPSDTNLSPSERSYLTSVIAGVGGFTVLSDDLALYTESEWGLLDALRAVRADLDTPLDIVDPFTDPLIVRSAAGSALTVAWDMDGPAGIRADLGTT